MPEMRSAWTAKAAVKSMSGPEMKSPAGTPSKRNASGKRRVRSIAVPRIAPTVAGKSNANANCSTMTSPASVPQNQAKPNARTAASQIGLGRIGVARIRSRRRQISHATIGGIRNPWPNVFDRCQIDTIDAPVRKSSRVISAKMAKRSQNDAFDSARRSVGTPMVMIVPDEPVVAQAAWRRRSRAPLSWAQSLRGRR
jgi:hypothetical protein